MPDKSRPDYIQLNSGGAEVQSGGLHADHVDRAAPADDRPHLSGAHYTLPCFGTRGACALAD